MCGVGGGVCVCVGGVTRCACVCVCGGGGNKVTIGCQTNVKTNTVYN